MDKTVFKSNFTLAFSKIELSKNHRDSLFFSRKKFSLYMTISQVGILIMNFTLAKVKLNDISPSDPLFPEYQESYNRIFILLILITGIYTVLLLPLVIWYSSNRPSQQVVTYLNYYFVSLLFYSIRTNLRLLYKTDVTIFYLIYFFEFIFQFVYQITGQISFFENFCITSVMLTFNYGMFFLIYNWWHEIPFSIVMNAVSKIALLISCYFIDRERSLSFAYNSELCNKNKWYDNILNSINTGFLSVKNQKIKFINNFLIDKFFISRNKPFSNNDLNKENIYTYIITEIFSMIELPPVESDSKLDLEIRKANEMDTNKNLVDNVMCHLKEMYGTNGDGKFLFISQCDILGNKDEEAKEMACEVFYRYYKDTVEENFEFIFNDVTRAKLIEGKNAEFKYKTIFLSKIAHEFKNPLICLLEIAEQLSSCNKTQISEQEFVSQASLIKAISNYMIILIKDLDYFSQMMRERNSSTNNNTTLINKDISLSSVSLNDTIQFVQDITKSLLIKNGKDSNVKFKVEKDKHLPLYLYTDDIKLKQILVNIISNSIKFTHHGEIVLTITLNRNAVLESQYCSTMDCTEIKFSVSDTGIGISQDDQLKLFQPFKPAASTFNKLGAGLGLSIVKDLTQKLGRCVEFTSEQNKGSVFWFSIPIKDEPTSPILISNSTARLMKSSTKTLHHEEASVCNTVRLDPNSYNFILNSNDRALLGNYQGLIDNNSTLILGKEVKETAVMACTINVEEQLMCDQSSDLTILIADDEMFIRKGVIRLIRNIRGNLSNTTIIEAEDGIETLNNVYKSYTSGKKIDVIISDENMNFLCGRQCNEILTVFEQEKSFPHIKYFICSAYEDLELNKKKSAVDGVFSKPLKKMDIITILNKVVK